MCPALGPAAHLRAAFTAAILATLALAPSAAAWRHPRGTAYSASLHPRSLQQLADDLPALLGQATPRAGMPVTRQLKASLSLGNGSGLGRRALLASQHIMRQLTGDSPQPEAASSAGMGSAIGGVSEEHHAIGVGSTKGPLKRTPRALSRPASRKQQESSADVLDASDDALPPWFTKVSRSQAHQLYPYSSEWHHHVAMPNSSLHKKYLNARVVLQSTESMEAAGPHARRHKHHKTSDDFWLACHRDLANEVTANEASPEKWDVVWVGDSLIEELR